MRTESLRTWLGLACFAGVAQFAAAAEERVAVSPDMEQVAIGLPAPAAGTLLVEIDGYDITAVVRITGNGLVIPTRGLALASGAHTLRVLILRDNGDLDTLLERVLEVTAAAQAQGTQSWDVLLGSTQRVAEHRDAAFAGLKRDAHRAVLQWTGERSSQDWTLSGNVSGLYDSAMGSVPGSPVWNAPGYLLQAERRLGSGAVGIGLGDDPIPLGNLLFSAFSRRGLRVDARAFDGRAQLQAFTLNSEPLTRLDADIVPASELGSVQGGYAVVTPLPAHPEWLRVSTGYVSGDTTLGGVATSSLDPVTRYGGQAWNIALDGWGLGSALWLHAEMARSHFDADGLGAGEAGRDDDAHHLVAQLSSVGALRIPGLDSWSVGYERQEVGTHFFSLGNLMLPGDLAMEHVYLRAGTHGVTFSADDTRLESDVNEDPLRPRRRGATRAVTASYTPLTLDSTRGIWRLLGVPTLSVDWQDVDWRQDAADALLAGFDLDSRQRARTWGLDLARDRVSLSLRRGETRYDDRSQALVVDDFEIYTPSPDTRETSWSAQITWTASDRLLLAPQVQSTTLQNIQSRTRSRNFLWGLQTQATLVPERWWLQANYSAARDRPAPFDPLSPVITMSSGGGTASLIHRLRQATGRTPDIDLQLAGQYAHQAEQDTWQIMLGFSVNWRGGTP